MILPLNKYNLEDLSNTKFYKNITELGKTTRSTLDFQKILPSYTNVCMKNNKYVRSPKTYPFRSILHELDTAYLRTYSAGL